MPGFVLQWKYLNMFLGIILRSKQNLTAQIVNFWIPWKIERIALKQVVHAM